MSIEALERAYSLEAQQQPDWPDPNRLADVESELSSRAGLVSPEDIQVLSQQMERVAEGKAFLLQTGDCAETFSDDPEEAVKGQLNAMIPATTVLLYQAGIPTVKVMRAAGQFAKPRSASTEEINGVVLPSYRGDIVNSVGFTPEDRRPNPERMLAAYDISEEKLSLLYKFIRNGFTDLENMHRRNIEFAEASSERRFLDVTDGISRAINFMKAVTINTDSQRELHEARVHVSHEGLVRDYERSLTRIDENGDPYASSGHMIWVGERTRQADGFHTAFAGAISNPVEVKIGPTAEPEDVIELCKVMNPYNIPGKLTLISRMGADKVREVLPKLMRATIAAGLIVVWVCDAMHGNTISVGGRKTRQFSAIEDEVVGFFESSTLTGTWPGGMHLETSGENVTECLGGAEPNAVKDLDGNYKTACDPRLNQAQTIELSFIAAEQLAAQK